MHANPISCTSVRMGRYRSTLDRWSVHSASRSTYYIALHSTTCVCGKFTTDGKPTVRGEHTNSSPYDALMSPLKSLKKIRTTDLHGIKWWNFTPKKIRRLFRSPTQNFIGIRRSVWDMYFFQRAVTDLRFQHDSQNVVKRRSRFNKMRRVDKGYRAQRLVAEFPRKKTGLLLLWNACYARLMRLERQTANPAVVDVALRALTTTLITFYRNDWLKTAFASLWSKRYRQSNESVPWSTA